MDPGSLAVKEPDKPQQSENVSGLESSSSQVPRNGNAEWWVVVLTTTKRGIKEYDVRVKEDTGTPVNWIHPNVVKKCKVDSLGDACPPRSFVDMSGKKFKCDKCVRITWCGRGKNSYEEVFFISPEKAPIDMILGDEFVTKHGRARDICADSPKTADARIFVADKPTKELERQMHANEVEHRKQSAQVIQQSRNHTGGPRGKDKAPRKKGDTKQEGTSNWKH